MRVVSFNANGIRSSARKGFFDWLLNNDIDILCIQETKAQLEQLTDPVFSPENYHSYFFDAQKKGYSGVAIYTKKKPDEVITGLDFDLADTEGRYIEIKFNKENLSVISLYLPSGSSGELRQNEKFRFMAFYEKILEKQLKSGRDYIICGDWNIVHKEIDIKNFKSNQKSSGCLPEERAWLDELVDNMGWVDAFRVLNQDPHQYTWWSNRGQAYANNVGWRIDYQFITPNLKDKVTKVDIYKGEKFSDHAPLIIDYDFVLS